MKTLLLLGSKFYLFSPARGEDGGYYYRKSQFDPIHISIALPAQYYSILPKSDKTPVQCRLLYEDVFFTDSIYKKLVIKRGDKTEYVFYHPDFDNYQQYLVKDNTYLVLPEEYRG